MLGKQSWKLLTNHDTILSQVFKAKYYPKKGFLDVQLGRNPGYVWHSIHTSQVVVKRGLRWRLGNGMNVQVWNQPRLRNDENAYVTTASVEGRESMKAAELVNDTTGSWNIYQLHIMFNQRNITEILKFPLNLQQGEDIPIGRYSRNVVYSVWSAYYQLLENIIDNSHLKFEGNWKKMWQLHAPEKVKIFLWRLLRGCLPVRSRLMQKGVQCNNKCPHCDMFEENKWHCFFGCISAQEVWQETEEWQYVDKYMTNVSGCVTMQTMIEEIEVRIMVKITMVLWTLWWRRNKKCWNDKTPNVFEVLKRARDSLQDWMQVQAKKNSSTSAVNARDNHTWTKPARGILKCNVDTACYVEQNIYCVGACLQDDGGRFVKAYMKRSEGSPHIVEAEALGVLE